MLSSRLLDFEKSIFSLDALAATSPFYTYFSLLLSSFPMWMSKEPCSERASLKRKGHLTALYWKEYLESAKRKCWLRDTNSDTNLSRGDFKEIEIVTSLSRMCCVSCNNIETMTIYYCYCISNIYSNINDKAQMQRGCFWSIHSLISTFYSYCKDIFQYTASYKVGLTFSWWISLQNLKLKLIKFVFAIPLCIMDGNPKGIRTSKFTTCSLNWGCFQNWSLMVSCLIIIIRTGWPKNIAANFQTESFQFFFGQSTWKFACK